MKIVFTISKKLLYLLPVIFLFINSCNILKVVHLMKSGEPAEKVFYTEVPFDIVSGIIKLNVTIDGKEYDFYLDSGAPNVVSEELAKELGLKERCKVKSSDSQGNKGSIPFSKLNSVTINDIVFNNQGVAIADFNETQELSCMNIYGLIGANMMRQAYWQINMKNRVIKITDNINTLNIPDNAIVIPFNHQITGTPEIEITLGNITIKNVIIDYGSNSGFKISTRQIPSILSACNTYVYSFGESDYGLYGSSFDTTYSMIYDSITLGNMYIRQLLEVKRNGQSTIGTEFLKKYIVSFDWKNNKVYLEQIEPDSICALETIGFTTKLRNQKLIVSYLYKDSKAYKAGLRIGDQILSVNHNNYHNITLDEYCDIVLNGLVPEGVREVEIMYSNEKEESKTIRIEKEKLL